MADTLVPEHVEYGLEADVESIVAGTLVGAVLTVVILLIAEVVDATFMVAWDEVELSVTVLVSGVKVVAELLFAEDGVIALPDIVEIDVVSKTVVRDMLVTSDVVVVVDDVLVESTCSVTENKDYQNMNSSLALLNICIYFAFIVLNKTSS